MGSKPSQHFCNRSCLTEISTAVLDVLLANWRENVTLALRISLLLALALLFALLLVLALLLFLLLAPRSSSLSCLFSVCYEEPIICILTSLHVLKKGLMLNYMYCARSCVQDNQQALCNIYTIWPECWGFYHNDALDHSDFLWYHDMIATSLVCSGSHISACVWTADTKQVKWHFLKSDYVNITPSNKLSWPCLIGNTIIWAKCDITCLHPALALIHTSDNYS